jgi:hypothetical protein
VTGSQEHRDPKYRPYAFTEHGALMAANILRTAGAVEMSVFVVRAFVRLRQWLANDSELSRRLEEMEKKYDAQFLVPPAPKKKEIGFLLKEAHAAYAGRKRKR